VHVLVVQKANQLHTAQNVVLTFTLFGVAKVRVGGVWVVTASSGSVRVAGDWVRFGSVRHGIPMRYYTKPTGLSAGKVRVGGSWVPVGAP
jgi:hypothetical protein